jgi:hypothetical protein
MKTLILASFLTLCASIAYAGSSCGGGGCDKDKKGGKSGLTETTSLIAGTSCGDKCGDKKKEKAPEKAPKTGLTESTDLFAGAGCGTGCGDKKDKKPVVAAPATFSA